MSPLCTGTQAHRHTATQPHSRRTLPRKRRDVARHQVAIADHNRRHRSGSGWAAYPYPTPTPYLFTVHANHDVGQGAIHVLERGLVNGIPAFASHLHTATQRHPARHTTLHPSRCVGKGRARTRSSMVAVVSSMARRSAMVRGSLDRAFQNQEGCTTHNIMYD